MILPGATVGVVGGGQLGRMFTLQARTMGYRVVVLDPDAQSPAGAVADQHIRAAYDDERALSALSAACAAVTTEFENVPASTLETLARSALVRPPVSAVAITQDRIAEKNFLQSHGFATAPFRPVRDRRELLEVLGSVPFPGLLKTSRLGYDGKGQATVESEAEVVLAFDRFGGVPCILEARLELQCELSVIVARGADGDVATFPVAENRHREGILETSVVPARISETLSSEASEMATKVAEAMAYVGVLGVELFLVEDGRLMVNEMAPRPHNSGHYTMDACSADQFEQQLRTLCGLPLAQPWLLSPVAMVNLLGDLWSEGEPRWEEALKRPGVRLHLYGKAEARPGRKMGHLNCLATDPDRALATALETRDALRAGPR
ncbi:MAG TPA: 5-(carboxyamino)imidazole ribonucleotide synthase [Gemmatimonadales bacterium]|nr:5-(carboxyamino)imidazole ribonucleotide synthase [Gemmatimonadales bacterium]